MKISVVMVCLNAERMIGRAIESFLTQTYSDRELVVVDGASSDRTLEIIRSFDDSHIRIHSAPDRGIYDAMNRGLALYGGDVVGFLNSDDRYHDSFVLESIASALAGSEIAFGDLVFVKSGADDRRIRIWKAGSFRKGSFRGGWLPPHPTFYIRREIADRVGAFDTRFGSAADYDYMLRALEFGNPKVAYIPRTLIDFSHGGASTNGIRSYIRGNLLCLRSRRERLHSAPMDMALLLKPLRKLHQFRPLG